MASLFAAASVTAHDIAGALRFQHYQIAAADDDDSFFIRRRFIRLPTRKRHCAGGWFSDYTQSVYYQR